MKRILLALLALAVLYLGGRALFRALASDETKIRWLIEQMEEAYDTGDVGDCIGPLAKDWQHEGYELDRELLRGALLQASFERDRETKQLLTKVDLDMDGLVITVDGDTAKLEAEATFFRLRKGNWEETWKLKVAAELDNGEDGWKIVKSRHQDLQGTHLGR